MEDQNIRREELLSNYEERIKIVLANHSILYRRKRNKVECLEILSNLTHT